MPSSFLGDSRSSGPAVKHLILSGCLCSLVLMSTPRSIALLVVAVALNLHPAEGAASPPNKGHLLIMGGGRQSPEMLKRLNRLYSVVLEHPGLVSIGIDESTAILVNPDGKFEVMGESAVMVIDARQATAIRSDALGNLSARNIRTHLLLAGDRFEP